MPESFHFLQPDWFYLLIPLAVLLLLLKPNAGSKDSWQKVIDKDLLPWLKVKSTGSGSSRLPVWLLGLGWLVSVIALANPVWEKLPQPVFQTDQARVIVLDLSLSMNSSDLKPARIDRARFKINDILAKQQEGVIGLVVFAGDAFGISPLTRDGETITALLQALTPDIMPVQGSRADLGLLKAGELLKQAGRLRGEVLLLADSYTDERTIKAASELRKQGVITSVLGIGTEQGAPLPTGRGDFVRNKSGDVVTTRLDVPAMQELARAGGGEYVSLTAGDADIKRLMDARVESTRSRQADEFDQTIRWKETGPWLVLLLLPFAALAFRRGWLFSIALLVITGLPAEPVMAFTMKDLWQRQDQQAHKELVDGDLEKAVELAVDPMRKGAAEYMQGNYEKALEEFASAQGAEASYNKGNALAKLGKYEEAIDAYEQALKEEDNMQDAQYNKEAVEKLLQQRQQQQQQQQNQKNEQGEKQDQQQGEQDQQNGQDSEQSGESDSQQGDQQDQGSQSPQDKAEAGEKNKDSNAFEDAAEQAAAQAESDENETEQGEADNKNDQQENMTAAQQQEADKESKVQDQSAAEAEQQETPANEKNNSARSTASAEDLSSEEQIAAEQWLRRIPDDPAGLLRRKLRYQYIQRGGEAGNSGDVQAW